MAERVATRAAIMAIIDESSSIVITVRVKIRWYVMCDMREMAQLVG